MSHNPHADRQFRFQTVSFEPTMRCNLACVRCYQAEHRAAYPESSLHEIERMLDRIDARTLWLIGGEVFMRRDIFDIIDYAASRGFEIGLTSNGLRVDEECARQIGRRPMLKTVIFSLDGPACVHNRLRQRDNAFQLTERAIRLTRDRSRVLINTLLCQATITHLPDFVDICADLGVPRINVVFEEAYTRSETEETKSILTHRFGWVPGSYALAVAKRSEDFQSICQSEVWRSCIGTARDRAERRKVELACSSPFWEPMHLPYYFVGGLRERFRLVCSNSQNGQLRLDPGRRVLACGAVRKALACVPGEDEEVCDRLTEFYSGLSRTNLLPICARCCKVRVVARHGSSDVELGVGDP